MNNEDIKVCGMYGFSVNLLIDNIECLIKDFECGEEITEEHIQHLKTRIKVLRKNEKPFQKVLGIQED